MPLIIKNLRKPSSKIEGNNRDSNESEAEKLYTGIAAVPRLYKILLNYANLLRTSKPVKSVAIYMGLLKASYCNIKKI